MELLACRVTAIPPPAGPVVCGEASVSYAWAGSLTPSSELL